MLDQDLNAEVENKLLLLYTYTKIEIPVNPMHVTELILKLNVMDYFSISHYTLELLEKGMLELNVVEEVEHYSITQSGKSALSLFNDRLSKYVTKKIDEQVSALRQCLTRARAIKSNVNKIDNDNYMVEMCILDGAYPLIDLKLNVVSNEIANKISNKWQRDATEIYGYILNELTRSKD